MKSTAKKVGLLLGCGFVVLGIILTTVGLGLSHFNMDQLYQRNNQHTEGSYEAPQKISVDLDDANISVFVSDTDQVNIISDGIELDAIQRADGTLVVKNKPNNRKWYELMELDWRKIEVQIAIPAAYQGSVSIQSDYGDITLEGITLSDDLTVKQEDGDITLTDCNIAGDVLLEQDYGAVDLSHLTARNLTVDYSDGDMRLSDLTIADQLEVSGESGKTKLENVTAKGAVFGLEDGSIDMENTQYEEKVLMELDYGAINLNGVTAQLLDFDVEDGDVEGLLLGSKADYKVGTQIEDGESNLKTSHEGEKEIRAKIEYGNLNLRFEK